MSAGAPVMVEFKPLLTGRRLRRISQVVSAQVLVQLLGFATGLLLVRVMEPAEFGYFTLAVGLVALMAVLCDLGLATAVLAEGGRAGARRATLRAILVDAHALQKMLVAVVACIALPLFLWMLLRQHATVVQAIALATLGLAIAATQVRSGLALSVVRLVGDIGFQQKLDLAMSLSRLVLLVLIATAVLQATLALAVYLVVALATLWRLQRWLAKQLSLSEGPAGQHSASLKQHLRQQAPNTIYFAFSSQVSLWLIGLFGSAQGVAELGALGRLAGLFALIGTVLASLAHPYFARHHGARELRHGFVAINLMFAGLLLALVAGAVLFPSTVLWLLGPRYAGLQRELSWMVLSGALASWAGALYSLGCARGWVLPTPLAVSSGGLAAVASACLIDVGSVVGSFQVNAAIGAVGVLVCFVFVAMRLRRHAPIEQGRS